MDQHIDLLEEPLRAAWREVHQTILDPGDASALQRAATAWDGETNDPDAALGSNPQDSLVGYLAGSRLRVGQVVVRLLDGWEGDSADALKLYDEELLDKCFETLQKILEQIAHSLRSLAEAIDSYDSSLNVAASTAMVSVVAGVAAGVAGRSSGAATPVGTAVQLAARVTAITAFATFAVDATHAFLAFKGDCSDNLASLRGNLRTLNGMSQASNGRWPRPGSRLSGDARDDELHPR